MRAVCWTLVVLVVAGVGAETVTIDPPNGVATNVATRFTGGTAVVVNSSATGGGIVRLNSSNAHAGGTTVNSGTLVLKDGNGAKGYSDLGMGGLTLGAGTLRYSGLPGGEISAPIASPFPAKSTKSTVLDVQSDVTITNNWVQNYGTFIKTGPGTVTFTGKNNFFGGVAGTATSTTLNDTANKLTFNANGDGPTVGVRGGFVLAEGTMIVEGDEATTNYFNNSAASGAIGTWTVDEGQEKSAVLEIRGGYNVMRKSIIPGLYNGNTTTGGKGVSSGLRLTGGYLRVGQGLDQTDETIFVGGSSSPAGYRQNSYPFIEVTGGKMDISKNFQLGNQPGVNTRLLVSGDGMLELGQYIGVGYHDAATTTNSMTIAGNGVVKARYVEMFTKAGASKLDVSIVDNGTFIWTVTNLPAFFTEASTSRGELNVFLDGGTISNSFTKSATQYLKPFHERVNSVTVGTRGATFAITVKNSLSYVKPFLYTNSVPGASRQPIRFLGRNNDHRGYHYLNGGVTWDGPVYIGRYAYLYLHQDASLGEDSDVTICRDGRLLNWMKPRTIRNLQLGEAGVTGGTATIFVTDESTLTVAGELRVPSNTGLTVYLQKLEGTTWNAGASQFVTPGDYPVLTVPATSRAALENLAVTYAHGDKCAAYFYRKTNADGTITLRLRIDGSDKTAGTTELTDEQLATVTGPADLTLGYGTALYQGTAGTVAGLTLEAQGAVLRTESPLTVGGIETVFGSLVKTGPAALTLAPGGVFDIGSTYAVWSSTAGANSVGPNGESPTAGIYGLTVREGEVVVKAEGVTARNVVVGSDPDQKTTPATLKVDGGSLALEGALYVSSSPCSAPNRVIVTNGTLKVGTFLYPGIAPAEDAWLPGEVIVNAGGRLELGEGTASALYRTDGGNNVIKLVLNEGGELLDYSDLIGVSGKPGSVWFDGGRFNFGCTETTGGVKYFRYLDMYVGAKGAIFDMAARAAVVGSVHGHDLHIGGTWRKDPALGDAPDGGITFKGHGIHYLGGTFTSSLEGDLTATDRAHLMIIREVAKNQRVVIKPGCALRTYETNADPTTLGALVLGEEGSDAPVWLESGTKSKGGFSFIVKGDLAVHSPVFFGTRTGWTYDVLTIGAGTYTTLVYKTSSGDVDVSKFQLDPSITGFKAEFTKVAITEGDHAGSTAIVLTTTASSSAAPELPVQRWTAAQGGVWSDVANWADGKKAVMAATFVAPGAADVPVTLDETPELRVLAVEGETAGRGYRFTGTKPLALASDESVPSVESVSPGVNSLTFDVPVTCDSEIQLNNSFGSILTFGNDFTSRGLVRVNPVTGAAEGTSGEVRLGNQANLEGGIRLGSGRVVVDSLAWVKQASDLTLVRGTLRYTGSDETIPGLSLNNASTRCAVLEVENDLTVEEIPTFAMGGFMKIGAGVLRFKGNKEFHCGKNNVMNAPRTDSVIYANGDGPTNCFLNCSIAAGTVEVGTVGDPLDAPKMIVSSQMGVGLYQSAGADAAFILNNGTVEITKNALRLGYYNQAGDGPRAARVTVNGGRLTTGNEIYFADGAESQKVSGTFTINGGEVLAGGDIRMGNTRCDLATAVSTLTVNGGTLTANNLYLAYSDSGTYRTTDCVVDLNGGVTTVKKAVFLGRNAKTTSTLTLNEGAVLKAGYLTAKRTGGTFRFNGGTLMLTGTNGVAVAVDDSNAQYLVGAKGAVIDTSATPGGVCVFTSVLQHDPALGAAPDGGLVKKGAGVLVIPADCTFTGPIVVEEGTVVKGGVSGDEGNVVLAANSVIECFTAPGMWDAGVLNIPGNLSASGPVYVDFGRTAENPIRVGERYPLALVGGELVGNLCFRAVNAGENLQLQTVFEDGVLMVEVVSRGLTLFIR